MNLQPTHLNQVVDRSLRLVQHQLDLASIQVLPVLDPDLPQVLCDAAQIEQVILALVMNALDAMPQGGNLWIETSFGHEPNQVRIVVRDDGSGIPPEILPRIFEPFLTTKETGRGAAGPGHQPQHSRASQRKYRSAVRGRSRHNVYRDSSVGCGPADSSDPGQRNCRQRWREVTKVETQGKMLIVDDELSGRDSLGKWFQEEGYEVGIAESAE